MLRRAFDAKFWGHITTVVLAATNPNLTGTVIETDGGARFVPIT